MPRKLLPFLVAFIALALPVGPADASHCGSPLENPHTYVSQTFVETHQTGAVGFGLEPLVFDTNTVCDPDGDGIPDGFDGDYEFGIGGAYFGIAGNEQVNTDCNLGLHLHAGNHLFVADMAFSATPFVAGYEGLDINEIICDSTDGLVGDDVADCLVGIFHEVAPTDPCLGSEVVGINVDAGIQVFVARGTSGTVSVRSGLVDPPCSDARDNDGDGRVDYPSDTGCSSFDDWAEGGEVPECQDGFDNDADGTRDWPSDAGCESPDDTIEGRTPQCNDGLDNDGDGAADYRNDRQCVGPYDDREAPDPGCNDGVDNDGDTKTDWPNDPGCAGPTDPSESPDPAPPPQCNDGRDNDADGRIDWPADPGCTSLSDNSESPNPPPTQCNDGVDNDGDGFIDHPADSGCSSASDTSESPTPQCDDGINNDNDVWVDWPADPQCSSRYDESESF